MAGGSRQAGAIELVGLRGSAISLGFANGLDAALHFVVPIALVRLLSVDEFGDYRLLWLAAMTAMLFAPLGMPRSLQYFLPRHNDQDRHAFIDQTFLFMLMTASLAALFFLPSSPFLPVAMKGLVDSNGYLVSVFVLFWVTASLIEVLPSALEKYSHQAVLVSVFSLARTSGILTTAWYYREVEPMVYFLVGFAVFKYSALQVFRYIQTGTIAIRVSRGLFKQQLRHALPFGINGMLNKGRTVTEQWIVAIMFTSGQFAVFSVAASIYPLLDLLKKSVNFVTVPKMSRLQSQGKTEKILELNNKGNIAVSFLLYPVLAFLLVNAGSVVELLYTGNYTGAANIMRLYACSMFIMAIEISSILIVYQQGPYVMRTSILMIVATVVVGIIGANIAGLFGVAFGGFAGVLVGAIRNYARVIHITGTPFRKVQNWKTIGVIMGAAGIGSFAAKLVVNPVMRDSLGLLQLPTILVLTFMTYVGLLFLFGHGRPLVLLLRGR